MKHFKITRTWSVRAADEAEAVHLVATDPDKYLESETVRVIQNSVTKIANGPLTCADSGGEMPAEGVLNNPQ